MTDPTPPAFKDDDVVYVDPDTRTVIGPLEWTKTGRPKSFIIPEKPEETSIKGEFRKRRSGRKVYPFGTLRSMRHAFLEKKQKADVSGITLDDVIEKAVVEPYWDTK